MSRAVTPARITIYRAREDDPMTDEQLEQQDDRPPRPVPGHPILPAIPDGLSIDSTLGDVREGIRERLHKGADCPACGQRAQLYRRRFNTTNARLLIAAYAAHGTEAFHAPTSLGGRAGGEWARLAHWLLIREVGDRRGDGGRAGYWRVTDLGARVALRRSQIAEYVLLYNGTRVGYDGDWTYVDEGHAVNLAQLLGADLAPLIGDDDGPVPARHDGQLTMTDALGRLTA